MTASPRIRRFLVGVFVTVGAMLATLIGALILIGCVVAGLAQSQGGRDALARGIERLASSDGSTLRIKGIAPGLPARLRIERVELGDAAGTWLTVDEVLLAWRPAALLAGRLHVEELSARRVDVSRLPTAGEPSASGTNGPPHLPRLPIGVRVDRFGIGELQLGEPVIGRAMRLGVEGRLAAADAHGGEDGRIRSALAVVPLDGGDSAVVVDADVDPATNTLGLEASINEPEGGLVGGLLGLTPRAPLAVRLAGRGPFEAWQGKLEASAGDLGRFGVDLLLSWGKEIRLEVAGRADMAPALLPQLAPALANGLRVETAVRQATDGSLVVDRLGLAGEGLRLAGHGKLGAAEELEFAADLSIEKRALAAGVLGPAHFATIDVQAVATGTVQAPNVQAAGTIAGLVAPGARAERLDLEATAALASAPSVADADAEAGGGTIDVNGSLTRLQLADGSAQAALGDAPRFALSAGINAAKTRLTLHSLNLNGRAVQLRGDGSLGLEDDRITAHLVLSLDDLHAIGAPAGAAAAGAAGIAGTLEGTLRPPALTGKLNAQGNRLVTGVSALDALLGPEPRIIAPLAWDDRTGLNISALRLDARDIAGEGQVRLSADAAALDGQLRLTVRSLAPLSDALGSPLQGKVVLDATASGNPADPQATLRLHLQDAAAFGTRVNVANAELRASGLGSQPIGRFTLEGRSDRGPLSASTDFALQNSRKLHLDQLTARGLGITLDGGIEADFRDMLVTGTLHAASESPEAGMRFGDALLRGPLGIDVRLTPSEARQTILIGVRGGPLSLAQGSEEKVAIGGLNGDATVRNAFADPQLSATVQARDISGPARIGNVRLTADGTPARLRLTLVGQGTGDAPSVIDAAADLSRASDGIRLDMDRMGGRLAGETLHLSRPMRIVNSHDRLELSELALDVGDGTLVGDGRLAPGEAVAGLRASAIPLRIMRALSPAAPAKGTLQADLSLRTEQTQTVGNARIGLHGVGLNDTGPADARFDADADLRLGGGELQAEGAVTGLQGAQATLRGRAPVRLPAGETTPIVDRSAPIDGRIVINADLARLSQLLALGDQRLEGRVAGDLGVGGSLADPELWGGLDLSDGLYENFVSGTLLSGLTARLEPRDRRTLALRLNGTDGEKGQIAAEGEAALDANGGMRTQLALRAVDATLVRRDDVTATLDADIAYVGDNGPHKLSGRVETRNIVVRLVDRLPPSVVELLVREIGRQRAFSPQSEEIATPLSIGLDMAISLPRHVFVRGRGLESEWSGALTVTGTSAAPRISGDVALVRGTFSFAGKRFTLQRGTVAFTGGQKIDPLIDAIAEYRSTEITAFIALTGLASAPEVTITSQPPLPESEILAQVLFGKSSAKLGPIEAVQLAAAVEALARGESTGENALSFVRTLLGLDTLRVQPSQSGEGSSVAVGSYVGDRVYIGAEQGLSDGSQTGTLEIEIAPGISIESEIGQATGSGTHGALGLKWKWDY